MDDTDLASDGTPMAEILRSLHDHEPNRIIVRNEFACVSVQLRDPGGRPRLLIEDLRTRKTVELDAIELESLAWAQHNDLSPLLDPSLTRWASNPQ